MFIHLGGDIVVRTKDVIAILDFGKEEAKKKLATFLKVHENTENLVWITEKNTKSIVITNQYIYGSPISSVTLNRRA